MMGAERPPVPDDVAARQADSDSSLGPPISFPDAVAANPSPSPDVPPTLVYPTPHNNETPAEELAPPATPPPLSLPRLFGRYRLLKVLGQGGMGTVYLAEDSQLGRQVALKVPHLGGRGIEHELVQRFYREARIAATFHHPHLCPIYDVGQVDGIHFLTMPLFQGELLSDWVRREGRLPPPIAVRLACQIARALAVAHRAGVVHRDLKPVNIMMNERREPVVLDFGLSRRLAPVDPRLTSQGAMLGTRLYASPEQLSGDPTALGPTCDVYSLGVTLYEMLTGSVPFRGSMSELFRQILTQNAEPPSRHHPNLDPRLDAICLKALAKDPRQRFASMEEFATALEDYLNHEEQTTQRDTATAEPKKGPHRFSAYKLWLPLAGGFVVLVSVLLWFAFAHRAVPTGNADADPFQPGTRWVGDYHFAPPLEDQGDATLTIDKRDGPRFQGEYATKQGKFAWRVRGEIDGHFIRWKLVEVIREAFPTDAEGNASVEGTYEGEHLEGTYKDVNSTARLQLRLSKTAHP